VVGELIGNFRITAQLGRGGMGDVYRGEQVNVGSRVAIKTLTAELSADHGMDTEASAGGRDPLEKVASRQVGVRSVR
jgi:serine/threonine protein kinase